MSNTHTHTKAKQIDLVIMGKCIGINNKNTEIAKNRFMERMKKKKRLEIEIEQKKRACKNTNKKNTLFYVYLVELNYVCWMRI